MQRRPVWICASAEARTWSRFCLAVFAQTLQFLNIRLLSLFTVLLCWAVRLGAVEEKLLHSSPCNVGAEKSKANLSYGSSQVSFPLFNVWGEHILNSYMPFLCYCSAVAAGREVWTILVSEGRMWRKSKGDFILTVNLTEGVPLALQEDTRLI